MSHVSHIWMSHVAHMNESCHTYEWVMSHTWMSHVSHSCVSHINETCYTYKCHTFQWVITGWRRLIGCLNKQVIFRERATNCRALLQKITCKDKASYDSTIPCITIMNIAHTYWWVMWHMWMRHVSHINELCLTYMCALVRTGSDTWSAVRVCSHVTHTNES